MPLVKPLPAASKYLAQKWEADHFRIHRLRVKNAPSNLDTSPPKEYPHLKLGLNKMAVQEEKQSRYDRENELLLNKIKMIVGGRGTINNWNQWSRKDLHAAARLRQQKKIELDNQAMLQRLKNTKPVIQRVQQRRDFEKHKALQGMLEGSVKDYTSPRTRTDSYTTSRNTGDYASESSEKEKNESEGENISNSSTAHQEDNNGHSNKSSGENDLPPLPAGQKAKKPRRNPPENKKANRTANIPKLPAI